MVLVIISEFMQDEIYLAEEIKYYKGFDKKIFFSVKGHQYSNTPLQMTNGLICGERDIYYKGLVDRLWYLAKGLLSKDSVYEIAEMIRNHQISADSLKSLVLFSAKSELLYDHIKAVLPAYVSRDDELVLYSYRFGIGVRASAKLRKIYTNAKIKARGHAQDIFAFRNKDNYLPYRKTLFDCIDSLFCISDDGRDYIQNNYPQVAGRIKISRLGTSDVGYNNNLSNTPFRVVTCSRIVPIKRLYLLIEALSHFKDPVTWIHYGNGEEEYQNEIKALCDKLPENVKVEFKGFVDNEQLHKDYSSEQFSIFVNVSYSEGLPVSIMEACSAGMPVIATDVGGTKEIVEDGQNGFLLDRDFKIEELVNLLNRFKDMSSPEYKRMTMAAREKWEKCYSSSNNYNVFSQELL